MSEKAKKTIVRHAENPFLEGMTVPVKVGKVQLSRLGKDDNVLVNNGTGEVLGTHVTTWRKVDAEQFVKIFTANITLTFDLSKAGVKAFNVLFWTMQNALKKDLILLDRYVLEEFLEAHKDRSPPIALSQPTFFRGLAELESAKIIAKNIRQGWYFVNPNFAFNGDRIAFTTVIEKQQKSDDEKTRQKLEEHGQQRLLD